MIYLDNGATSFPKPKEVADELLRAFTKTANPGRSSHKLALESARLMFKARNTVKEFINAESTKNIVFTKNCTEALDIAIFGALAPGDHVVTTVFEHNSVLRPLHHLKERGVELTIIDAEPDELTDEILRAIRPDTRMVAVSHVDNLIGFKKDIAAIGGALSSEILFLVDAAQSIGHERIDVQEMNIDLLAAPGHKALMGPMGTGFLYIKEENALTPFTVGGTGSESSSLIQPDFTPDKFEAGTQNVPGVSALAAGIEWINGIGLENISNHIRETAREFYNGIKDNPKVKAYGISSAEDINSVVSINIEGMDSGEVSLRLDSDYDIATRPQLHCAPLSHKHFGTLGTGMVRFSFGYFNTVEEAKLAAKAVNEIAK